MATKITSTNETLLLKLAGQAKARWVNAIFAATDASRPDEKGRLLLLAQKHQQVYQSLSQRIVGGK